MNTSKCCEKCKGYWILDVYYPFCNNLSCPCHYYEKAEDYAHEDLAMGDVVLNWVDYKDKKVKIIYHTCKQCGKKIRHYKTHCNYAVFFEVCFDCLKLSINK